MLRHIPSATSYIPPTSLKISSLIAQLQRKAATTSYPNLFDDKFKKLKAKAQEAFGSNSATTETIWTTLTELTTNLLASCSM